MAKTKRKPRHHQIFTWGANWRKHTVDACRSAGMSYHDTRRIIEHLRRHGELSDADTERLVLYADWDLLALVPTFMMVHRPVDQ